MELVRLEVQPNLAKQIGIGNQKKDSLEAIKIAISKGINFFDTADMSGHGKSEKLLGDLISNRNDIFICTKFGNRIIKVNIISTQALNI